MPTFGQYQTDFKNCRKDLWSLELGFIIVPLQLYYENARPCSAEKWCEIQNIVEEEPSFTLLGSWKLQLNKSAVQIVWLKQAFKITKNAYQKIVWCSICLFHHCTYVSPAWQIESVFFWVFRFTVNFRLKLRDGTK